LKNIKLLALVDGVDVARLGTIAEKEMKYMYKMQRDNPADTLRGAGVTDRQFYSDHGGSLKRLS